ncbi:MAG: hypothetical protein EBY20_03680 [Alphaproteobacteria bacterium]|nr:hypothetical protein [Alphaproteobacteria bacterium]
MSLLLSPLGKKEIGLRPIAVVQEGDESPIGLLKVSEDERGEKLIELPKELHFTLCPETRDNLVHTIFISGGQGCGKSTFAGSYCKVFIEMFHPDPQYITIISADDVEDPAYDFPHRHIKIDDEFADDPPDLDEFTNPEGRAIVIFDDCEITDKKKERALQGVMDAVLTRGRKRGISCIFISHRSADSKRTKMILTELNVAVWFPKLSSSRNTTYFLHHHLGMHEGMRNALKAEGWGRWVAHDYDEVDKALKKRTIIDKKRAQKEAVEMLEDNL